MSKQSNNQSRYGILASKIFQPNLRRQNGRKRTAPPRPPPPSLNNVVKSQSIPSFGIAKNCKTNGSFNGKGLLTSNLKQSINESCLIDLSSPPNSPYAGSGSDGVSVNSFSSENSCNNQSASEDLFDPFGLTCEASAIDPFSLPLYNGSRVPPSNAKPAAPSWDEDDAFTEIALRHEPSRRVNLEPPQQKFSRMVNLQPPVQQSSRRVNLEPLQQQSSLKGADIPKITQPAPQAEVVTFHTKEDSSKSLRTTIIRPKNQMKIPASTSCPNVSSVLSSEHDFANGKKLNNPDVQVADVLHDYNSTEVGDLSLKAGQKVEILRNINDDWLYGKTLTGQGMFPSAFVQIISVELPAQPEPDACSPESRMDVYVTALFTFPCQVTGDLALQEGQSVRVLGKIDDQWLYGEVDGRRGQFPTNYVESVPSNIPQWTSSS